MGIKKFRSKKPESSQKRPVGADNSPRNSSKRTVGTHRAQDYPLVVRFIDGYVVVTAPDFQFPVPALKRMDLENPNLRTIGEMVYMTYLQAVAELKERDAAKLGHPAPSRPREAVPRAPRTMSLAEASKILGLKPHVVRLMADSGEIRASRTPGGHRRFLRDSVEEILKRPAGPALSQD